MVEACGVLDHKFAKLQAALEAQLEVPRLQKSM